MGRLPGMAGSAWACSNYLLLWAHDCPPIPACAFHWQLVDSEPDWIIVALCGLDEPTTVAELEGSLAKEPVW